MSSPRFSLQIGLVCGLTAAIVGLALWNFGASDPQTAPRETGAEDEIKDDKMLALSTRKRLWDIEHRAFLVEVGAFADWKQAFAAADRKQLETYFAPKFTGRVPDRPPQVEYRDAPLSMQRLVRPEESGRAVDARGFVDFLLDYAKQVHAGPGRLSVSIGLVQLRPRNRNSLEGGWNSEWKIRLAGRHQGALGEAVLRLTLELAKVDGDTGLPKASILNATIDRVEVTRSDKPLMRDITAQSGIAVDGLHDNWLPDRFGKQFRTKTGGVYACDYDRDGLLDVLVEDLQTGATLYRGLGRGRFEDVTEQAGLPRLAEGEAPPWTLCVWADFDGDGDEDLILQDKLFENRGDGTFRDVTKLSNLLLTPAASYAIADFDRDGRVDLYVCHSNSYLVGQKTVEQTPWIDGGLGIDNVLWRNKGNWQFEDVTSRTNAGAGGTACFAAVWFDANNDRWPDLLAINEFGRNTLLINDAGKFSPGSIDRVFGGLSMGVTAGDLDNDGATDLYVANMYSKAGFRIVSNVERSAYPEGMYRKIRAATTGNKLYLSSGDGRFRALSPLESVADVGWAYGPNFVDLNGDGWLDIYATAGFRSITRGKPDG